MKNVSTIVVSAMKTLYVILMIMAVNVVNFSPTSALTAEPICEVRIMAEYVVVLTGYVLVNADSEEEAIEKAVNEAPNEISAEIVEIHDLADE